MAATRSNSQSTSSEPTLPDEIPNTPHENMGTSDTFWENMLPLDLSDIQFRAIELTIQGLRDTQIAQTLGINRKTLWQWKTQHDDYCQALTIARTQLLATTGDRCQNIAQKATAVLASFLEEHNEPNNRIRSAQILLSAACRFKPAPEKRQPAPPED